MLKSKKFRAFILAAFAVVILFASAGCVDESQSTKDAQKSREDSTDLLRKKVSVETAKYPTTLENINAWTRIWGTEGVLSYVYMQRQDGEFAGYYVFRGPPVSYCTSGAPPYKIIDKNGPLMVPIAGSDGAYYGNCDPSRYYGVDAVTGQIVEYTDGMVLTAVVSNQPLELEKQPKPFISSVEDAEKNG